MWGGGNPNFSLPKERHSKPIAAGLDSEVPAPSGREGSRLTSAGRGRGETAGFLISSASQ